MIFAMPGSLLDSNIWVAAAFRQHAHYIEARAGLSACTSTSPAHFCRATQLSFLRLISTPTVHRAYGQPAISNEEAAHFVGEFMSLAQVRYSEDPPGTTELWLRLASRQTASPKVWMDAYLAAFAIRGQLALMTLDKDFRVYVGDGLDLQLLGQPANP